MDTQQVKFEVARFFMRDNNMGEIIRVLMVKSHPFYPCIVYHNSM